MARTTTLSILSAFAHVHYLVGGKHLGAMGVLSAVGAKRLSCKQVKFLFFFTYLMRYLTRYLTRYMLTKKIYLRKTYRTLCKRTSWTCRVYRNWHMVDFQSLLIPPIDVSADRAVVTALHPLTASVAYVYIIEY